jgi:predicted RNA binding protein YcfA (HicA-like mRNA interferase family)
LTGFEVLRRVKRRGCQELRRRGSHAVVWCPGGCQSVVPIHREDMALGTLRAIERQLAPCLGEGWLR